MSNLAAEPDPRNSLCSDEAEHFRSLQGILEGDNSHAVTTAVVPGLIPGEPLVSLPPGEEKSLTLKVVVPTPGGGDGLNIQLAKLEVTLVGGNGEGDGISQS